MTFFTCAVLFVFGLAVGSFLNVIGLRYQERERLLSEKTTGGRSFCVFCRRQLRWFELIPLLSFLIQRGKCNGCGKKIFWQYPFVELLSGLIFVFVPYYLINFQFSIYNFQSIFQFFNYQLLIIAVWILIFLLLLLLSIIDFRLFIIPDSINLALAILGFALILFSIFLTSDVQRLNNFSFLGHYALLFDFNFLNNSISNNLITIAVNRLFAAFVGMAFFGAIILLSRGRAMGMGDFKLIAGLGLIFGWPDILMIAAFSFIIGAVFSVPFLIKGVKTMKDAVPFGPFIVSGAVLNFFFGYQIIESYFKLFGAVY